MPQNPTLHRLDGLKRFEGRVCGIVGSGDFCLEKRHPRASKGFGIRISERFDGVFVDSALNLEFESCQPRILLLSSAFTGLNS